MNRPLVQALAGLVVFVVLAATSIVLTNALFNVAASSRPSVTFTIAVDSPEPLPQTASPRAGEGAVGRFSDGGPVPR